MRSISKDIETGLEDVYFPNGYSYKIGGMNEELNSAFKNLGLAILLAIVLVYMVMASQFESFAHPFIIMFAVPLAIAGGGLGLFVTRNPVSVPALIGGIMLTGIVVNNGIVLIDYTNHLKKNENISYYEALLIAGPTRLRPILMTTLTTVLGLLPLALGIGEGSEGHSSPCDCCCIWSFNFYNADFSICSSFTSYICRYKRKIFKEIFER